MSTSSETQAKQSTKKRKEYKKVQGKKQPKSKTDKKSAVEEGTNSRKKLKEEKKKNKRPRYRIFPIWLRIIVVSFLCALALVLGLMLGYGVIGDGNPTDALDPDTWRHIRNIVVGEA